MIQLRNVSKRYRLFRRPLHRALEMVPALRGRFSQEFWALRDVSLTLRPGTTVGLVGPNGAGKSTLLKIIAGTTFATRGELTVEGRVAALLELGTGFHPEFTGRQNLYIGGRMLGLSDEEIRQAEPEIVAFAELGRFIDQPLRTYSSGMMMRLGFAVASCVRPDVLIVDEALSVGDAYFSQKCIKRLRQFQEQGVTILFVSHDPGVVLSLCTEAHLLEQGQLVASGAPRDVMEGYNALIARHSAKQQHTYRAPTAEIPAPAGEPVPVEAATSVPADPSETSPKIVAESWGEGAGGRLGNFLAIIESAEMLDAEGRPAELLVAGRPAGLRLRIVFTAPVEDPTVGILIRNRLGLDVFGTNTALMRRALGRFAPGQRLTLDWSFQNQMGPGDYTLTAAVHRDRTHLDECFDWIDRALVFKVVPSVDHEHIGVVRLEPELSVSSEQVESSLFQASLESVFSDAPAAIVPRELSPGRMGGLLDGWRAPERAGAECFCWSGPEAGVLLRPAGRRMTVDAGAYGRAVGTAPVVLSMAMGDGRVLGTLEWPAGARAVRELQLPDDLLGRACLVRWAIAPVHMADGTEYGLALHGLKTT